MSDAAGSEVIWRPLLRLWLTEKGSVKHACRSFSRQVVPLHDCNIEDRLVMGWASDHLLDCVDVGYVISPLSYIQGLISEGTRGS